VLGVVMLSVVMLNVVMLNVVMLSVVMLHDMLRIVMQCHYTGCYHAKRSHSVII
jgi:hypothetical protein